MSKNKIPENRNGKKTAGKNAARKKEPTKAQSATIIVVITTAFITTFTGSALNLSIPDMGAYFRVSASMVGWLVTAYMLTVAALSVQFGRIADLTDRKRILTIGILVFSLSSAGAVFGVSMWMLIALRIAQGVGGAMIFSTNTAVLISAFPGEDRGRVLGYSIAATYVGLSAGPVAGGLLNHNFGWRSIFVLTALIGFGVLLVAWRKLPPDNGQRQEKQEPAASAADPVADPASASAADPAADPASIPAAAAVAETSGAVDTDADGEKTDAQTGSSARAGGTRMGGNASARRNSGRRGNDYDVPGNLLYIGMIVLTLYGLSDLHLAALPVILTLGGLVLGVLFVIRELRTADPIIQIRMFKENLAYSFSNLAALLNYGATFAIGYLMSIYLQVVMGYSSQTAGLILIVQPVLMALLSPYAGRLSDRISPFKLASFGMALCAAGILIFAFVGLHTPLWVIIAALTVTGIGFAFFSSPNTNAVMACVRQQDYGVASSILATMRSIGHTSSMVVVTVIVSRYMGTAALADAEPELLIRTMHTAFLIFVGVCGLGIFFSLKRKNTK